MRPSENYDLLSMSTTPRARTISGTIRFEDVRQPAEDVTIYVRVEEVSRLDAPASRVVEAVLRGVHVFPGSRPIPFVIREVLPAQSRRYVVRAHADVDGDGKVSRGDYVSVQSYPVLTTSEADRVDIVVREVR
jgi:hypothetical protein